MMDRQTWLARILSAIRDFADADYQERVWVRGQGPEVDSSTEAVCRLLDDYDLPGFLSEGRKKHRLSNEQLAALRALEAAINGYLARENDRSDDAARIATPEWQELRERARSTLAAFPAVHPVSAR
jgi:hypothetical protein